MSEAEAATKAVEATEPEAAAPVDAVPAEKTETAAEAVEGQAKDEANEETDDDSKDQKAEDKSGGKKPNILKTSAQIDEKDYSKNRKYDPSKLPETDDHDEIRNQVEFYFGDSNLPTDKFMWELTGGPDNKPVPLKELCKFKRMRRFQPYEAVVAALRDSKVLDIVGGGEGEADTDDAPGEEKVRRKVAYSLADQEKREKRERSIVYVKGFGDETPSTQFDLEAFFTQFAPVQALRLRRTEEKLFKGSVFVEFQDEEQAKRFVETDPPPQWQGHDLKIMTKKAYAAEKLAMIQRGEMKPGNSRAKGKFYEGRDPAHAADRRRGGGGSGGDKRDWKERRNDFQKNGFRGRGGGRGRGRGGRGGWGRGGGHNGDRSRKNDDPKPFSDNGVMPRINSSAPKETSAGESTGGASGKRTREEDGGAGEPAAKKVDTKADVGA